MIETDYGEAAVEVLNIFNNMNVKDIKKIPQSFREFLMNIASKDYKVNFDNETDISRLNLQEKTKEILGFVYITWLCDREEFTKWKNVIQINKAKNNVIVEKYNPDDLFGKKDNTSISNMENKVEERLEIVEYKEKNLFQKIFDKIKNFFI